MANIVLLAEEFDTAVWELVRNELDELETSRGVADPDPEFIGFAGESLLPKYLQDLDGRPLQLFMQATWTAIDPTIRFQQRTREFEPDIKILDARLLDADEPIYLVDDPHETPDPDYTWQGVFLDDPERQVDEALDDVHDQLFYEV